MTSFSKPTSDLVSTAVTRLTTPQHMRDFLGKLRNPHWIIPLKDRDFFKRPPELIRLKGGGIRCPSWPQSEYLARMAALVPDDVASILATIETDNWAVAYDMIAAAKAMPPAIAARVVDTIGRAMRNRMSGHLLVDVGELIARLSTSGEANAALRLTEQVFALSRDPTCRAQQLHDDYNYFESMNSHVVPSLSTAGPRFFLPLLVEWMTRLLENTSTSEGDLDHTSFIWRPAIEDHPQNHDYTFAPKMLDSVRRACEMSVRSGAMKLTEVLQIIAVARGQVFHRLRLHLIAEFASHDPPLAQLTMMDRSLFDSAPTKHEYARLMGLAWPLLTAAEQRRWLSWVDAGPEGFDPDFYDKPEDEERTAKQRACWQFQRLHWIRDYLDGSHRLFYDDMIRQHGEPELSDLIVHHGEARWGSDSPMSVDDLEAMGFENSVAAVTSWRPDPSTRGFDAPDLEGLADTFRQFVARRASEVSKEAALLKGSPPIFTRVFIAEMERAVKEGKDINLESVLNLALWVVRRPVEERAASQSGGRLVDGDWQWCRDAIASLVEEIANARDTSGHPRYGAHAREQLWEVVRELPSCPAKEYIVRKDSEDPRDADWPLIALNATRGKAMRAVLAFAEWASKAASGPDRSDASTPKGFDAIPEVRDLLESELARPDADSGGWAMFGWRFGLLYELDRNWTESRVSKIFDLRAIERSRENALGWSAWTTFLFSHRPHIAIYSVLRDQYSYAVDQSVREPATNSHDHPSDRLAEHLIVLFGRGNLGDSFDEALSSDDGIIQRLVTRSHPTVRSHAMHFVGSSLRQGGSVPAATLNRFSDLWSFYWNTCGRDDAKSSPRSNVFGYWFCSGLFDPKWSIRRLLDFVITAPLAEPDDLIVEQLSKVCQHDPLHAVKVIQALVLGDTDGWRVSSWKDDAKIVLQEALRADKEASDVAKAVIDRLGRRGFSEFGQLLKGL